MLPLYDESHSKNKTPWITIFLIALNFLLFFVSLSDLEGFIDLYGFSPQEFELQNIITSMFFHGSFLHLLGNMWFLWIFGDNLEKRLGGFKYIIFYLVCGAVAAVVYAVTAADKTISVIGASGAISGVLGAYLILFPKNKIRALVPVFFVLTIISVPAFIYIFLWFAYQFLYLGSDPMIAYWAHIGGFLAGVFLIKFFTKK